MRLSEAIKLGSLLGPHLRDGRLVGPGNASCVMGAALLALGVDCTEAQAIEVVKNDNIHEAIRVQSRLNYLLPLYFPGLQRPVDTLVPALRDLRPSHFPTIHKSLFTCLWQMNDGTWLTRQEIADWLIAWGYDCDSVDIQQQEQHECQAITVTA